MAFEPHGSQPTVQPPDKTTEGRAVNTGTDWLATGDQVTVSPSLTSWERVGHMLSLP